MTFGCPVHPVPHHTRDPAPWVDEADIVLVGEPGVVDGTVPPVTVSVTALGHGGPDDGLDLPEEVLQARSGSLSAHGHAGRPPLTVGGNIGEYVTGAFAAKQSRCGRTWSTNSR